MSNEELSKTLCQIVDYLLPELTPYETTMYLFILRHTVLSVGDGANQEAIRIGKRTIAGLYGKGVRGDRTNMAHITSVLKSLEEKGCIRIGDAARDGTLYTIVVPKNIPLVMEKLSATAPTEPDDDYFTSPEKRKIIFERDKFTCQYCGEKVTDMNATLDHYIPQSKGGGHHKENLRTACLACNSIKSGRTFEEAAPLILSSIRDRKAKT
jgi:hypothetical protein